MNWSTETFGATNSVASRFPGALLRVQGYNRGAADSWLQFHDAAQLPAVGAVPKRTFKCYAGAPFHWAYDPGTLLFANGIVVCLSTTEATLTVHTDVADFQTDGESQLHISGASIAGDLATARETLDIFTTAKTLFEVKVKIVDPTDITYVQLFELNVADLVSGTTKPLAQYKHTAAGLNDTYVFNFGAVGRKMSKCCVAESSSGTKYVATGSNDFYIQGVYK